MMRCSGSGKTQENFLGGILSQFVRVSGSFLPAAKSTADRHRSSHSRGRCRLGEEQSRRSEILTKCFTRRVRRVRRVRRGWVTQ